MGWSGAPDFVVKLKITTFEILDFRLTAAAAASQELSHLARPLTHHAQGPNIPFGESLTSMFLCLNSFLLDLKLRNWRLAYDLTSRSAAARVYMLVRRSEGFPERDIWFLGTMD